jgi:aminopeptidase N
MKKISVAFVAIFSFLTVFSQKDIDILHYKFEIALTDQSDTIHGHTEISLKFLQPVSQVVIDLKQSKGAEKGMYIDNITGPGVKGFMKYDDSVVIALTQAAKVNDSATYTITYAGIPGDGLIISRNKFGQRTFFADNWPDRAHQWIPCVDNPGDKASVEFVVTAPDHYQVISNGIQIEETNLTDNRKLTHWKEDVPLPTKVMVIGVAEFAVQYTGDVNCIPVSTWVYSKNRNDGFSDYAPAKDVLSFFNSYIAPYPYRKLANVQSKTTFGGMENASAIFYFENSVDGKKDQEELFAHEIVHQWFGNMATEKNYSHLWLSEGFATYLTTVYMEKKYGEDKARMMREEDRGQVVAFMKSTNNPVVDSVSPFMNLLNANSYQKGGWILHMLRRQLGDSVFHKAVQQYYLTYAGKNADTRDLEQVFEKVSGKNLSSFFKQWLYTPGVPKLEVNWKYDAKAKNLLVTVQQLQQTIFDFPLELSFETHSVKEKITTIQVSQAKQTFTIPASEEPTSVKLDPKVNMLFEGKLSH